MNTGLAPGAKDERSRWHEMIRGAGKLAVQRWVVWTVPVDGVPVIEETPDEPLEARFWTGVSVKIPTPFPTGWVMTVSARSAGLLAFGKCPK